MSHAPTTFSPAGTPLEDLTIGELVAQHPGLSRIFQSRDIDFCCQGGRTVREVCTRNCIPLSELTAEIRDSLDAPAEAAAGFTGRAPADLVHHLMQQMGFVMEELPRLHELAERVARRHGGHTPTLVELFYTFDKVAGDLGRKIQHEETTLFPMLTRLFTSGEATAALAIAIERSEKEHATIAEAFAQMRALTADFVPPPQACNSYRALFAGLAELNVHLDRYFRHEEIELFPTALKAIAKN
jgi:regulator of cell morphogenesis and NO signaling